MERTEEGVKAGGVCRNRARSNQGVVEVPLRFLERQRLTFVATLLLAIAGPACSPETYRESADREVSEILAFKQEEVLPREKPFALTQELIPLDEIGVAGEIEDLKRTPAPKPVIQYVTEEEGEAEDSGEAPAQGTNDDATNGASSQPDASQPDDTAAVSGEGGGEEGALTAEESSEEMEIPTYPGRILDQDAVVSTSLANNRDYQRQKESVYLAALSLTLARYNFAPRFFGIITGDLTRDGNDNVSGDITTDFGWNQLFASGARLSISAFSNFLKFFNGDRDEVAESILGATLTQPLLRGFGSHIVQEPLTQSERDTIYEIRTFERFRKTFAVDVISSYYDALGLRNVVTNEWANWQDLVTSLERVSDFAEAGLSTPVEVDQAEQQVLSARNRWINAVDAFDVAVDRLKITLGIPMDQPIGLLVEELAELAEPGDELEDLDLEEAMETALRWRLDLMNTREQVDDAERRVAVAADALRMQLDVSISASLPSDSDEAQKPFKFDTEDGTYGAGFDLDLPFDRKAERNAYVRALIDLDRSKRDYSLAVDNVRLEVREAYRRLQRERQSFAIQDASVELAVRRVDSTSDLQRAGRAQTRDVLESQAALIDARNQRTRALISYTIARLSFHLDTGTMRVEEDGNLTLLTLGNQSYE